ncbi:hypothetical protein M408DRAFT_332916 [Serendipita vermifera MAFF 305830]|uniref:Intradiol ring-cleavage dioxygenases domain-containing protein n=1 Tax=Serendipita vermifera MAFF 305830 TaxID=933852 RepID=A0A0C2WYT5_SERVB|nr:hypothetical protein M408DRAFT_332916 [Serendipita vermifera MAFF 305830]
MLFRSLLAAVSLVSYVHAHAEPSTPFANHPVEVARRQLEMNKRHVMARNCASEVAAFQKRRMAKRALRKRQLAAEKRATMECVDPTTAAAGTTDAVVTDTDTAVATDVTTTAEVTTTADDVTTTDAITSTSSAVAPHYSTIQNTCVTAPEVTEGPYYLRDEYVRADLREDQAGVTLVLDIGVLDMATCQPATDVFVEIWNCNAQGEYSAFGSASQGSGGGGNGTAPTDGGAPPSASDSGSATDIPASASGSGGFTPSGTGSMPAPSGGPGGGGGGGGSGSKINADNFLRGGLAANENGVAELTTIYPGFYTGRTVHTHVMIHQNINYHDNGTIISTSGALRHIGQIFYDETINGAVLATDAYLDSGNTRTYNVDDGILQQANEGGYSAFAQIEWIGETLDEGLLGYITIGIDTSALRNVTTNNYWDPDFGSEVSE